MQISYRGVSYSYSPQVLETLESGVTGKFRGNSYSMRRPVVIRPTPVHHLTYRGINY